MEPSASSGTTIGSIPPSRVEPGAGVAGGAQARHLDLLGAEGLEHTGVVGGGEQAGRDLEGLFQERAVSVEAAEAVGPRSRRRAGRPGVAAPAAPSSGAPASASPRRDRRCGACDPAPWRGSARRGRRRRRGDVSASGDCSLGGHAAWTTAGAARSDGERRAGGTGFVDGLFKLGLIDPVHVAHPCRRELGRRAIEHHSARTASRRCGHNTRAPCPGGGGCRAPRCPPRGSTRAARP